MTDEFTGTDMRRQEDGDLLTGRATFTDDLGDEDTLHLAFVRSEEGHADIRTVDISVASAMDGVEAVYTWGDVEASSSPGRLPVSTGSLDVDPPGHPILADGRVRYHGQPIAAVVATDRYVASDAVDAVEVTYDPRPAVIDPVAARADDAPQLFDVVPDNVAATTHMGDADATTDAFAEADHVVELDLENNRLISSALEPRAALAEHVPDPTADAHEGGAGGDASERDRGAGDPEFRITMTSQSPHGHRRKIAHSLGVPEESVRVISPSVGGGFGHKGHHHPGEAMAAWSARELGQPVKWTATRSGNYLEGAHGRDHRTRAALALDEDGTFRGIRAETDAAVGGYAIGSGGAMPGWYGRLLSSQYDVPAIHCETRAVFTTTAPTHSYRGAGRPEAVYVTERLVDAAARELGLDPVDLRRRNLIDPDQFPYETAVGATYDTGDYEPAMEKALDAIGYEDSGKAASVGGDETASRDDGRDVGVGIANYVESSGGGTECAVVSVDSDGSVTVAVGTHSHGQGHATTYAQLVGDALEIPYERIHVAEGDTDDTPDGTGTFGSRSTIVGGNAVVESAEAILERMCRAAGEILDVHAAELSYSNGTFSVMDDGSDPTGGTGSISFTEVARVVHEDPTLLEGESTSLVGESTSLVGESTSPVRDSTSPVRDSTLEETTTYEPAGGGYSFGTHAAEVSVDPATGSVTIERYVAVDDCGHRVNPMIVDGQVHGGVAQGIGQALTEAAQYDADGRLITDAMDRYGIPRASSLPTIETDETVTPSTNNDLGVKGIGEGGTIAAPPAVVHAVLDALEPHGVDHLDMPLTDENVWRSIHD